MRETVITALMVVVCASVGRAQDGTGADLFARHCAACHEVRAGSQARAPSLEAMAGLSPDAVVTSLETGRMRQQGQALTGSDRAAVAEFLTGRPPAARTAAASVCAPGETPLAQAFSAGQRWNGWGAGPANTRFQSAASAGLAAEDLPRLELLWAFGFPDALAARTQPTVVGDWLFTAAETGAVYALDARTGCTRWTFQATAAVRTAITVAPVTTPDGVVRHAAFFGDGAASAYAVDAASGEPIWMRRLDDHPHAVITGAPAVFDGRVYVPTSAAGEEVQGPAADYPCCTFRGSVSAIDAATGDLLWQTYSINEPPRRRGTSVDGVPLYGPSGAGIWSAPTIDPARGLLYAATGNGFSDPPQPTANAIVALRLDTGAIAWVHQTLPNDVWLWQCDSTANADNPNCPAEQGPDFDFGASPVLATTPSGRTLLVIPQKSGVLYALDPDDSGRTVWTYRFGTGSALGGQWGAATDGDTAYVGVGDARGDEPGGLHAVDLESGGARWVAAPRPPLCDAATANCHAGQGGAVTATPTYVLSGGADGGLRAYATADGRLLFEYDTNREFTTVNGVPGRGATIDAAGPVVVGGRIFVNSGYNGIVGRAGNVLLAFGLPEDSSQP